MREGFWIGVLALVLLAGGGYVFMQHGREQRRVDADVEAFRARLKAERGVSVPPEEEETRRIAREEAERVMSEHGR